MAVSDTNGRNDPFPAGKMHRDRRRQLFLFIKEDGSWNKRAETFKESTERIDAAYDQRTDSGIKTFRNKTGTGRL